MAEIINLRSARKARARVEAEAVAARNRILFGRTKAQKVAQDSERAREARTLDNALREQPLSSESAD